MRMVCQQTDLPGASLHFSSPFLHPLQVTWVPHFLTSQGMRSRGRSRPGAHPDLDSGSRLSSRSHPGL